MTKKGQALRTYTEEFKFEAVRAYLEGCTSYKRIAEQLDIRNCSQLTVWVKKWQNGISFDERKNETSPLKGRPRKDFASVEEERDYLKARALKKSKTHKQDTIPGISSGRVSCFLV